MSQTIQERNKALVLEAFDILFNKRDYVAAERYWSPTYIQHSAHIAPGREGLFNLIKSMPPTLKYEPGVIVAEGDLVIVHGRFSGFGGTRELDRGRPPSDRGWCPCRTLGRHPGRGDSRAIQEWQADVRRLVSGGEPPILTAVKPKVKRSLPCKPLIQHVDVAIDHRVRAFLKKLNSGGGKPMEELSPQGALARSSPACRRRRRSSCRRRRSRPCRSPKTASKST